MVGDLTKPGVQSIINRLKAHGTLSAEGLVDNCLDLMGPLEVDTETRSELVEHASDDGDMDWNSDSSSKSANDRVSEMLQLISSLRDYQYA
jgi:hypothetical protein